MGVEPMSRNRLIWIAVCLFASLLLLVYAIIYYSENADVIVLPSSPQSSNSPPGQLAKFKPPEHPRLVKDRTSPLVFLYYQGIGGVSFIDQDRIACAAQDVRVFLFSKHKIHANIDSGTSGLRHVDVSPTSKRLVIGGNSGDIILVDT